MMPDLFISYSTADKETLAGLTAFLDRKAIQYWKDTDQLTIGTPDWLKAIEGAIQQVKAFVVLLSPDAASSPWVTIEIGYVMGFRVQKEPQFPVFPIIINGEPKEVFPPVLKRIQWIKPEADDVDFTKCWNSLYRELIRVGVGAAIAERSYQFLNQVSTNAMIQIGEGRIISRATLNNTGTALDDIQEIERFLLQQGYIQVFSGGSWQITRAGAQFFTQHVS